MENKFNLPEPLVKALTPERHRPVPGRFGVTTLIDSPLRRILTMRHYDDIQEDVSENFWIMIGKMGHRVLELDANTSEVRIAQDIAGATVVGVVDYIAGGKVVDFKLTSVWAAIFASEKSEWEQQLQIYAYLIQLLGGSVTSLENWLILRDWNVREWQRSTGDYPEIPFKQIVYKLWDKSTVEAFISERVSLHLKAEKIEPGPIPEVFWCNSAERWEKPTKYAIHKEGQVKAVRVFDSYSQAEEFLRGYKGGGRTYIETRPGEQIRCASYCQVAAWCPCFAKLKGDLGG